MQDRTFVCVYMFDLLYYSSCNSSSFSIRMQGRCWGFPFAITTCCVLLKKKKKNNHHSSNLPIAMIMMIIIKNSMFRHQNIPFDEILEWEFRSVVFFLFLLFLFVSMIYSHCHSITSAWCRCFYYLHSKQDWFALSHWQNKVKIESKRFSIVRFHIFLFFLLLLLSNRREKKNSFTRFQHSHELFVCYFAWN